MRKISFLILFSFIGLFCVQEIQAQESSEDSTLIQFSGQVIMDEDGVLVSLPYVNVYIKNQSYRGDYTDENGFFSLVARKGETVVFSGIGLKTVEYTIPDSLTRKRYSIVQMMTADVYHLSATVIYPWPSKEHFKIEFLAMDVSNELQRQAEENLSSEMLDDVRETLPPDGIETSKIYLREQAQRNYSIGQFKPMRIMSPLAWAKFIKAWKDGKFKRKKKDED